MNEARSELPSAAHAGQPRDAAVFRAIAGVSSLLFVAISFAPREGPANYRYSFLFLVPLVWAVLWLRRKLDLHPAHFALFALVVLLHDLGAFGFYQRWFLGIEYDYYVHFLGGLAGGLYFARAAWRSVALRGWKLSVAVVLLVTGVGGVHEIIEGFSTMVLGPVHGMLKTDGDPYDTQEDLLNNVLGSLLGVSAYQLALRRRERAAHALAPTRDPLARRSAP